MQSLRDNAVWELVELPVNRKPSKCVKVDGDGGVKHFKARLVAQDFTQTTKEADHDETFLKQHWSCC